MAKFKKTQLLLVLLGVLVTMALVFSGCISGQNRPLGWSGVAISGDSLYFGSMDGKLISLEAANGNPIFQEEINDGQSMYGTPQIVDGVVYISTYSGTVYAINADSGNARWQYPKEDNLEPIVSGVTVVNGLAYFGCTDGNVYAIDIDTGEEVWQATTEKRIWATPVVDEDTIYVGSFDGQLYALDASDGSQRWTYDTGSSIAATALLDNGTVYFGSLDRTFYAVDAATGNLEWSFPPSDNGDTGPSGWFLATAVAYNGNIFAANLDGYIYVLDGASGNLVTKFNMNSPVAASPVISGQYIVFAAESGQISVIDGIEMELRQMANLEVKIVASLTAADGIVYVHTQEKEAIYAFNTETRQTIWNYAVSAAVE